MDTLREYAKKCTTITKYPRLNQCIKRLDHFIGSDDVKNSIASCILYNIAEKLSMEPKRRSNRKRNKVNYNVSMRMRRNCKISRNSRTKVNQDIEERIDEEYDESDKYVVEFDESEEESHESDKNEEESDVDDQESDEGDDEYLPFYERYIRSLNIENTKQEFMHTLLLGEPGSGKTTLADIIVDMFSAIDIVDKTAYIKTTRSDWIGKYQGQSVAKAKKLIQNAEGGAIFIDEAYSLIAGDNDDMYGMEVLTEIVESMSNPDKNVVFILAGYEDDMKRLFTYNSGLERRFGYIFRLEKPNPERLMDIFYIQLRQHNWKIRKTNELRDFFIKNFDKLRHAGGSTNILIFNAKQANTVRCIKNEEYIHNELEIEDLQSAIKVMERNNMFFKPPQIPLHIYT